MLDLAKRERRKMLPLKLLREKNGLSQPQLAQKAGTSVSTIWRAERGQPINRLNANRIAKALGVDLTEIEGLKVQE
jgi:transcriptional regulator with XRE-family HTH domain